MSRRGYVLSTVTAAEPAAASSGSRRTSVRAAGLVLAVAVLLLVVLLSIAVGARGISLPTVWRVLWDNDGSSEAIIVHDLRIPRTFIGLMVGASLGLAGALMQALTRNPLADPGLLGVDMGAAAAIVVAIGFFGIVSVDGYVWFAFVGAGVTSVVVYLLGASGRAATPERMVLAGVAVQFALSAFIYSVIVLDPHAFDKFRFWQVGSLAGRSMDIALKVAPFLLLGVVLALGLARSLNALALGDEAGRALGARIPRTRLLGVVAIMLLCGASTAAAGPIAFIGLTVPHVARMIAGPDQRWVLPYSMVLAPILLLSADVLGRVIIRPGEMQVGIVTAFLGAPVFIALCRRRRIRS